MVNTFYIADTPCTQPRVSHERYIPDYDTSAQLLDFMRCNKQIIEACQIRNILDNVNCICSYHGWEPVPQANTEEILQNPDSIASAYLQRCVYYRNILQAYKALPYYLARNPQGQLQPINKDIILDKNSGWTVYKLGFSSHTAVFMWLGYRSALDAYINAHIRSWCQRKKKDGSSCQSNTALVTVPNNIAHPWWICCTREVVYSHRANLLRKEYYYLKDLVEGGVTLEESDYYYSRLPQFQELPLFYYNQVGYLWPSHCNQQQIRACIQETNINILELCDPLAAPRRATIKGRRLQHRY